MEEGKRKEILQKKINIMNIEQQELHVKKNETKDQRKSFEFQNRIQHLEELKKFMKIEQEERKLKQGENLNEEDYAKFIDMEIKLKMEELNLEEEVLKERKKNMEERLKQQELSTTDEEALKKLEEKRLKILIEERKFYEEQQREEEQILNEIAIQEKKETNRLIEIEKRLQFIEIEVRLLEQDESQGGKNAKDQFLQEQDVLKTELLQVKLKLEEITNKNRIMIEKFESTEKERKKKIEEATMKRMDQEQKINE